MDLIDACFSSTGTSVALNIDGAVIDNSVIGGTTAAAATFTTLTGASLDISGDIDVDGTTNLDVVDIDGAVDMASTLTVGSTTTITTAVDQAFPLTVSNTDSDSNTYIKYLDQGGQYWTTGINYASNNFTLEYGGTNLATFANAGGLSLTTADNLDTLSLISTDADANSGPNLRMYRNSGSPADGDTLGAIEYEGRNDNSQDVVYAKLYAETYDVSDGTEDGRFFIETMVGGTATHRMYMNFNETVFNEGSVDLDFRVESNLNTHAFFIDGAQNSVIGVGVTPEGWEVDATAIQVGGIGAFWGKTSQAASAATFMSNNVYDNAGVGQAYIVTDEAAIYKQDDGIHTFQVSASGSADAVISWTTGFEVLNSGYSRAKTGLLFGTDTAAANALDDYEEGTWTPALVGSTGSAGTWAMGSAVGYYTKIGRAVTISTSCWMSNAGSYTGVLRCTGLPFTNSGTSTSAVALSTYPSTAVDAAWRGAEVAASQTRLDFKSGSRMDVGAPFSEISTGYYLNITGTYFV
jgi:hypothetical protein